MQRKQEMPKGVPKLVSIARIDANSRGGGGGEAEKRGTLPTNFSINLQIKMQ
jgi:hypothetical protein